MMPSATPSLTSLSTPADAAAVLSIHADAGVNSGVISLMQQPQRQEAAHVECAGG